MVDRYGKSHNLSHRKFLRYAELMVQHHEENQMPVIVHQGQGYVGVLAMQKALQVPKRWPNPKPRPKWVRHRILA